MKIVIHETEIRVLAESVVESFELEALAEAIRDRAQENAQKIMHRVGLPSNFMRIEEGEDEDGPFVRIFADDEGKITQYLARKEELEHVWLQPAVDDAMEGRKVL